jgi:asparagine N-glycosylation enzyme membrane subunit Stt3
MTSILKKNTILNITFFAFLLFFIIPNLAKAQGTVTPPPPPTGTGITYECVRSGPNNTQIYGDCTFNDLMAAVVKVVNWATVFAVSFSVVVITWAGALYMVSGANASKRTEANKMLRKAVIGLVFMLSAWLIVTLIASGLSVSVSGFFTP